MSDTRAGVRFGEVFAVAEFRGLWVAQVLSLVGDQLARVALAVLVFSRTGSALLTGLVYALGLLSGVIGGPLLTGLADRLPHRTLMIRCDLARAALVALMAVPRLPFVFLCALVVAVELVTAPFGAARATLLPHVLPDDRYLVASAVGNMTNQSAQVLGFAGGGGLALFVGTSPTLLVDAATFGASALVLRAFLQPRPAVAPTTAKGSALLSARAGVRLVLGDRRLRLLVALAWLCGCYVVPEGLAAPYAHSLGGGAGTVGMLMAAQPLGAIVGALLFVACIPPAGRGAWMGPLAVLSCAPLLGCLLRPSFPETLGLWLVSGVGTSYQLTANSAFVLAVPAGSRGQAFGLVQAGIVTVQGATILLAGAAAQHLGPAPVVALAGAIGTAVAVPLALGYRTVGDAGSQPQPGTR